MFTKDSDYPLVSILIPCFNCEQWIAESIESALNQSYTNKQVIVIDDGSIDKSLSIIKEFGNRITWEARQNKGSNAARNRLLQLAKGEWLQYLDADDYLLPNKIQEQVELLRTHKDADIIYSPVIIEESFNIDKKAYLLEMPDKDDFYINFIKWGPLQTSAMLWKKNAILDVGGWKVDQVVCQEHELMLRFILSKKRFVLYNKANSVYRQSNEATVSKKNKIITVEQRMKISDRIGQDLEEKGLLDKKRLYAINLSRFECARYVFEENEAYAKQLFYKIKESDESFWPQGPAAPIIYRLFFLFGFDFAETVSKLTRPWRIKGYLKQNN